ncbi:MAG: Ig-like domain-containing protein [Balneolaceae bacterium]|nr:Ig-like domain-containing protein [Balneolaceae bacterium]
MRNFATATVLLALGAALLYSCATPTSPSGGEPDRTGPKIIDIIPESGTTNFEGSEIELSFDEFIERSSMRQAVIIEPDIGLQYSLDWGRKSVAVEFDNPLPDSTTVLVTIGTELSDTRGNEMSEPVRIAVSTGSQIDEGEIVGRLVDAQTGRGTKGDRILLYRTPADLTQKADYLAQTDTSGSFNFTYLRQGKYKVFWVNDQNRSKIWEQEREQAQPFYQEYVTLEEAGKDTLQTIYKANSDTTQPTLQGIGLFSTRRMRVRFSENIELTDSTSLAINDTLGNTYTNAFPLYIHPQEPYVLYAQSQQNLQANQSYQLDAVNVSDLAGNVAPSLTMQFEGSAQEDSTQQRIIRNENNSGIFPDEPLEIVYAKPITEEVILDSLEVVDGDTLIQNWQQVETQRNRLRVMPPGTWQQGIQYEVRVWNPVTLRRKSYPLNVWHSPDYGQIVFNIADSSDHRPYRLILSSNERGTMLDTTFTDSIKVQELPPLTYKGIIYGDQNKNGRWDPGQVQPFMAPEPYFIQRGIPVKDAMTAEVPIVFE